MNIPPEAVQAAAEAIGTTIGDQSDSLARDWEAEATAALTAALPHLRKQIAAEVRDANYDNWETGSLTIDTAEQLDALPIGAVVLAKGEGGSYVYPRKSGGWEYDNCCGQYWSSEKMFTVADECEEVILLLYVPEERSTP